MSDTKIEWADRVWNPVTGCTKVSEGCQNCYAASMAKRFWKDRPFSEIRMDLGKLDAPLYRRKPSRVFVNSMGDLFHPDVPESWLRSIWIRIAHSPQHTFMVLTKRADRMQKILTSEAFRDEMVRYMGDVGPKDHPWPFPNLWLGVTAENQARADERIPLLLQTPAAVRFVSAEPLLGPVDLSKWLRRDIHGSAFDEGKRGLQGGREWGTGNRPGRQNLANSHEEGQPLGWRDAAYPLPSQEDGEQHWRIPSGATDGQRGTFSRISTQASMASLSRTDTREYPDKPQEWAEERESTVKPGTGDQCRECYTRSSCLETRANRPDGREECNGEIGPQGCSGHSGTAGARREAGRDSERLRHCFSDGIEDRTWGELASISWCIVGGESGAKARPVHPDWIRSLRDQCQAAGVPFFFKQWGEWSTRGEANLMGVGAQEAPNRIVESGADGVAPCIMSRAGKKRAGRLLESREWNEFPEIAR